MIKHLALILATGLQLTACATATRGATTLLVVNTTPTGANVITSVETKQSRKLGTPERKKAIENGTGGDLKFEYLSCDPTPCGIEVPRKARFDILISKDGHVPQIFFIDRIHRKDVAKQNSKKVALATGAAAGAGAATAVASGATLAGVSIAAPFAIIMAIPVLAVGGTSVMVDAASGANFDLTPNPVMAELQTTAQSLDTQEDVDFIVSEFYKRRQDRSLGIIQENLQMKKIEMCNTSQRVSVPCEELTEK